MKTKYVKVPVSERLPEKEEEFLTSKGELYFSIERKQFETYKNTLNSNPSFWLEEKEDHSEEMLSVLSGLINDISNLLNENDIEWQECGYFEEAKKLINTIKNG